MGRQDPGGALRRDARACRSLVGVFHRETHGRPANCALPDVDQGQNRYSSLRSLVVTLRTSRQSHVYRIIGRRVKIGDISTEFGYHMFRAIGIKACLRNRGRLEVA